jgi:type I restriction enzyme, S subunit
MNGLPRGWTNASIEQLAGAQGLTTDGDWIETKDQDPNGDVRLIQLADIGDGEFRDRSARFVTSKTVDRLNCTLLEKGDLLIARMPDPLGRACVFPGVGQPAITAVDVLVWRPQAGGPLSRWLMHFVNSEEVRNKIAEQAGGTTRQRVAGGRVKQLVVPVPPLPEQRRIVAKIDRLFAKSKRARDHLDHIPRLVEKYKQAILAAAFRGDLTREWRHKYGRDAQWLTRRLDELIYDGPTNGWSPKSGPDAQGALALKLTATTSGYLRLDDVAVKRIYETPSPTSVCWLKPGDLLVQRSNTIEYVGAAAIFDGPANTYIYPDLMMRVRIKDEIDRKYVWKFLNAEPARRYFRERATGTAGNMPKINGETLRSLPVFLPPTTEERSEIIRRIESAFAWIDRLASQAASARTLIGHLDQAILAKAFRGELVPQDPADEPAGVLLDRIRAARSIDAPARGRRRPGA